MFKKQYRCEYFAIHELVPEAIYKKRGEKAWQLLDIRLLITLDRLRDKYGPIKMNDYFWGGVDQWRGLRTANSPYYSETSQHTFGRAGDPIPKLVTAQSIRDDIIATPDLEVFEFINSYEENTSWFHFDVRNCDRILTYPIPLSKQ